jgi:hypothetical protein
MLSRFLAAFWLPVLVLGSVAGCATSASQTRQMNRAALRQAIESEPPGDYFIGRRFYKTDYKFWGFVRSPGQPWSSARIVMLNENTKLAPDRQQGQLGSDNTYEYKLFGKFSGQTIYEPASNGFYPEFILKGYELRSATPPPIFRNPADTDPQRRVLPVPY